MKDENVREIIAVVIFLFWAASVLLFIFVAQHFVIKYW